MADSIFTKIINGQLPSHKLYEDRLTLAFLNIYPAQPGHTLVIPKRQIEFIWDLDQTDYAAVMATVHKMAVHMRSVLSVNYIHAGIVGTDVPHAHVHLIPFNSKAELHNKVDETGEPDHQALAAVAAKLSLL